jgi:hypothetical protein
MGLRFIHADAQSPARADFDAHLAFGSGGIRLAVCYFLKAGLQILRKHRNALLHPESFVVVSIDVPTDLDALAELDRLIPGRVFIHLGWITPEEKKKGGAARMHSKVCLCRNHDARRLWVGSHNLTANAMGGANIEAALVYDVPIEDQVMVDADQHLWECRSTAEPFDIGRLDEYKQLQARKSGAIGVPDAVLVLHAEEVEPIGTLPAVIHVRLQTVEFDALTKTDSLVHLFLHPPGTLRSSTVIGPDVKRYSGRIIEDNRTADHPGGGSTSTMRMATHWLEFDKLPVLIAPGGSTSQPVTQAAILLEAQEADANEFLYSLTVSRARAQASSTVGQRRNQATPADLLPFFTSRSKDGVHLVFAPREHIREAGRVKVYEGTPIPKRFARNVERTKEQRGQRPVERERELSRRVEMDVAQEPADLPLSPYFFRSSFRVRTDDEAID